ncbi:hypothetical protein VZT92_022914 [Zoarces viviparus]|uniref:Uncharacterized protein n=1 Tax=Zoarces viviparus TaxID=48416 RepID=A0AAW1E5H1_ZOAVI
MTDSADHPFVCGALYQLDPLREICWARGRPLGFQRAILELSRLFAREKERHGSKGQFPVRSGLQLSPAPRVQCWDRGGPLSIQRANLELSRPVIPKKRQRKGQTPVPAASEPPRPLPVPAAAMS